MATIYHLNPNTVLSRAYDTGTEQEAILVPLGATISCMLSFDSAGTASLQATNFSHDVIAAGDESWEEWDKGAVTATTSGLAEAVTAVRCVRTSGTPRLTVTIARGGY